MAHTRRHLLKGIAAGSALMALPKVALASRAEADALLKKLLNGAAIQPGKVNINLPMVVDNGANVPMTITVDAPMTPELWVQKLHVVGDGNPLPFVATYHFTAQGKAEISTRIRLSQSQRVRAVAVLSDGTAWGATFDAKVTLGGCGG